MEDEIWHSLAPLQLSRYFISTCGRLKNKDGRMLSLQKDGEGYMRILLYKDDKSIIQMRVHTLLGKLLLGCDGVITADHIDRNRSNNKLSNLRAATKSEQRQNTKISTRIRRPIAQLSLDRKVVKVWDGEAQIEEDGQFTRQSCSKACKTGKIYKGHYWEFLNDKDRENEIWKSSEKIFPEYETFSVSSHGRLRRNNGRTIDGYTRGGYKSVKLQLKGNDVYVSKQVHILILACFEGLKEGYIVNHKDGKKQNNRLDNLEYVTHSGNAIHARKTGLRKPGKTTAIPVQQFTLTDALINTFDSMKSASLITGIHAATIGMACNNSRQTAGGFKWKKLNNLP